MVKKDYKEKTKYIKVGVLENNRQDSVAEMQLAILADIHAELKELNEFNKGGL